MELQAHHIDFKSHSHELEGALSQVVPSIEGEIEGAIRFNGFATLRRFQEHLFDTINSKRNSGLLYTFANRSLVNEALKTSLEAARLFYDADDLLVFDAYDNAKSICSDAKDDLHREDTIYATDFMASVPDALLQELDREIDRLQLAQPATLHLEAVKKKYPLHLVDTDIDIRLELNNSGGGTAFDVQVGVESIGELNPTASEIYVGTINPNETRFVQFTARVLRAESLGLLNARVHWMNFDRKESSIATDLELEAQDASIDWASLENSQPYALDVAVGDRFIGRSNLLNQLLRHVSSPNPASLYLWGQKRVGKTSLVRALAESIRNTEGSSSVVYLETIRELTATQTTDAMCRRLVSQLRFTDHRFNDIEEPEYVGSLSPLIGFLDQLLVIAPEKKLIIIIDEFDELPVELYKGRGVADSFFQMLGKGIAGKTGVGVILVGGERIPQIIRAQGMRLNMYRPHKIDHFERNTEFIDLVRQPGAPLEFADDAIEQLWNYSAGNPFFLNEICSRMADIMIERRDAYITKLEVDEAIFRTLRTIESNSFAHYWADGLIEADYEQDTTKIVDRIRLLVAAAEALNQTEGAMSKELLSERAKSRGCKATDVDNLVRDFLLRDILVEDDNRYHFRVKLFQDWLCERGAIELGAQLWDDLDNNGRIEEERIALVSEEEIEDTIQNWGNYLGNRITNFQVQQWLSQFNGRQDRRLMFRLLQNVRFYREGQVRKKFQQSHRPIVATLVTQLDGRHRRDFLVSYLGPLGKSGAWMARLYRQSNEIWHENCLEHDKIGTKLLKDIGIRIVVFVDDFVGTGQTAIRQFKDFLEQNPDCVEMIKQRDIDVWYVAVAGTREGIGALRRFLETTPIRVNVTCGDELDDDDKAFSTESPIWVDSRERELAREIAMSFGKRLEGRAPLGFGDTQGLIVFEHNCPNTSLPILYKRRKAFQEAFQPLFPRSS